MAAGVFDSSALGGKLEVDKISEGRKLIPGPKSSVASSGVGTRWGGTAAMRLSIRASEHNARFDGISEYQVGCYITFIEARGI